MTAPIGVAASGAAPLTPAPSVSSATSGGAAEPDAFGHTLHALLQAVDESAGIANAAVGNMLEGTGDVHQAMIALQNAENSLQLTVQVRNKLVQAYQDVMRMSI